MPIRAGLEVGQVEVRRSDITGAVVNLVARVEQAAEGGEIYTTTAIREMLIGTPYVSAPEPIRQEKRAPTLSAGNGNAI